MLTLFSDQKYPPKHCKNIRYFILLLFLFATKSRKLDFFIIICQNIIIGIPTKGYC